MAKLVTIEGYVFNPDAIDVVLEGAQNKCCVCFRGGQTLSFQLSPKNFADKVWKAQHNQV